MKRFFTVIIIASIFLNNIKAQKSFRYGITAGLNISSAILPELKLNTNIHSLLKGDNVVKGNPQLADFVSLYKAGIFFRYDARIGSVKFNINYTRTNIKKELDLSIFTADILNMNLSYLDLEMIYQLNLTKHIYFNLGYIPSFLLSKDVSFADVKKIDSRILSGFGIKIKGISIDFDAIVGITEIIDGSYIHNVMFPITLSVPIN